MTSFCLIFTPWIIYKFQNHEELMDFFLYKILFFTISCDIASIVYPIIFDIGFIQIADHSQMSEEKIVLNYSLLPGHQYECITDDLSSNIYITYKNKKYIVNIKYDDGSSTEYIMNNVELNQ